MLLAAISSAARAQVVERIEIADPGIYRGGGNLGTQVEPGSAGGTFTLLSSWRLVEATTTIPATLGVLFGFQYRTFGPVRATARLKFVTLVPEPGIRNPNTGTTSLRGEYFESVMLAGMHFKGYSFDHSWEIATGMWTFEIWEGDRKLASQSFNIIAPY